MSWTKIVTVLWVGKWDLWPQRGVPAPSAHITQPDSGKASSCLSFPICK